MLYCHSVTAVQKAGKLLSLVNSTGASDAYSFKGTMVSDSQYQQLHLLLYHTCVEGGMIVGSGIKSQLLLIVSAGEA